MSTVTMDSLLLANIISRIPLFRHLNEAQAEKLTRPRSKNHSYLHKHENLIKTRSTGPVKKDFPFPYGC